MPELPEVETMRRGILATVGARIERAERVPCRRRPIRIWPRVDRLQQRLAGQTITAIERLGKRVVVCTDLQDRLIFEPRMTGLVLIESPPTVEHLRFRLILAGVGVPQILYWDRRGLGSVQLLSNEGYRQKLASGSLGPDACEIRLADFRQRLRGTRRPIKVALLDQRLLAGVGNLYASEILHRARINPQTLSAELEDRELARLHRCMQKVLAEAIRYEGSTLSDGTYRNALNQAGSYQNHHCVYDREGERCPSCRRGRILRIVQAQRSTFFCERCQGR